MRGGNNNSSTEKQPPLSQPESPIPLLWGLLCPPSPTWGVPRTQDRWLLPPSPPAALESAVDLQMQPQELEVSLLSTSLKSPGPARGVTASRSAPEVVTGHGDTPAQGLCPTGVRDADPRGMGRFGGWKGHTKEG